MLITTRGMLSQVDHVETGRYFGEKPDDKDKASYCNRFCDVCKNPQEVMAATQALVPQVLVATQMPQIQTEADEEWYGEEEISSLPNRAPISRMASLADSDDLPPPVQGLPGFAKASDLHNKRPIVEILDDDDNQEGDLAHQLFPVEEGKVPVEAPTILDPAGHQPLEEQVWIPRKRLNRDLSRHNSASTSTISLESENTVEGPQVLTSTPRINPDIAAQDDFWAQPVASGIQEAQKKNVLNNPIIPLSPPRAPVPKPSIVSSRLPQPGPSRCRRIYSSKLRFGC